jgi:flagellar basal body rod protein FlgG
MIRGLRVSAQALTPLERAQEILANNLANSVTGGFRQDRLAFHSQVAAAGAASAAGTAAGATGLAPSGAPEVAAQLDLTPGGFETTQNPLNLAVNGPGFFVVQGPDGELYTRDGSLRQGPDGTLLHKSGYPILTEGGTVTLPPGAQLGVAADGTVFVDGSAKGKLRLAALTDARGVTHAGAGLLRSETPAASDGVSRVIQGAAEASNVDPVLTMVEMMNLLHGYEADQRAILAQDEGLGRLIQWAAG